MNGKLIDTNILIYLSKKKLDFSVIASPGDNLFISVITYMEVLGYNFESEYEKKTIEELCKQFPVIELNTEIVSKVIIIRQLHKIKLPDAIILAMAAINNLELVTANISDFVNIEPNMEITNPMY